MAKKTPPAVSVSEPHTAETVLALFKSLSQDERNKVFEQLNGDPENEAVGDLLRVALEALRMFDKLLSSTEKLWGSTENATFSRKQWDEETVAKLCEKLRVKVGRLQPKRGMTPDSLETLMHYHRLYKECNNNQIAALHKLVKLPSEKNKQYVQTYQKTGNIESVRQNINRLRRTERKRQ